MKNQNCCDETRAKLATAERLLKVKPKVIIHDEPHLHQLLSERDRALERIVNLRASLHACICNEPVSAVEFSYRCQIFAQVALTADDEASKQGNVT